MRRACIQVGAACTDGSWTTISRMSGAIITPAAEDQRCAENGRGMTPVLHT